MDILTGWGDPRPPEMNSNWVEGYILAGWGIPGPPLFMPTLCSQGFAGCVQESQGSKKLLDKVSNSMRQAHTALMLKEVDPEFATQTTYFSELGEKMSVMERIVARLHGERETLQLANDDFSVSLFHWAANEKIMTQPLQKLASCVEKCSHLLKSLVRTCTLYMYMYIVHNIMV